MFSVTNENSNKHLINVNLFVVPHKRGSVTDDE